MPPTTKHNTHTTSRKECVGGRRRPTCPAEGVQVQKSDTGVTHIDVLPKMIEAAVASGYQRALAQSVSHTICSDPNSAAVPETMMVPFDPVNVLGLQTTFVDFLDKSHVLQDLNRRLTALVDQREAADLQRREIAQDISGLRREIELRSKRDDEAFEEFTQQMRLQSARTHQLPVSEARYDEVGLRTELAKMKTQYAELERKYDDLLQKQEVQQQPHTEDQSLRDELASTHLELSRARKQVDEVTKLLARAQTAAENFAQAEAEVARLQLSVQEKEGQLELLDAYRADIITAQSQSKAMAEMHAKELSQQTAIVLSLEQQLREAERLASSARVDLVEKEAQISKLQQENDASKDKNQRTESALTQLVEVKEQLEKAKRAVDTESAHAKELRVYHAKLEEQLRDADDKLERQLAAYQALSAEAQNAKAEHSQDTSTIERYKQDSESAQRRIRALESEIDLLKQELDRIKRKEEQTAAALRIMREGPRDPDPGTMAKMNRLEAQLEAAKKEESQLREDLEQVKLARIKEGSERELLRAEIAKERESGRESVRDLENAKSRYSEAAKRVTDLETEVHKAALERGAFMRQKEADQRALQEERAEKAEALAKKSRDITELRRQLDANRKEQEAIREAQNQALKSAEDKLLSERQRMVESHARDISRIEATLATAKESRTAEVSKLQSELREAQKQQAQALAKLSALPVAQAQSAVDRLARALRSDRPALAARWAYPGGQIDPSEAFKELLSLAEEAEGSLRRSSTEREQQKRGFDEMRQKLDEASFKVIATEKKARDLEFQLAVEKDRYTAAHETAERIRRTLQELEARPLTDVPYHAYVAVPQTERASRYTVEYWKDRIFNVSDGLPYGSLLQTKADQALVHSGYVVPGYISTLAALAGKVMAGAWWPTKMSARVPGLELNDQNVAYVVPVFNTDPTPGRNAAVYICTFYCVVDSSRMRDFEVRIDRIRVTTTSTQLSVTDDAQSALKYGVQVMEAYCARGTNRRTGDAMRVRLTGTETGALLVYPGSSRLHVAATASWLFDVVVPVELSPSQAEELAPFTYEGVKPGLMDLPFLAAPILERDTRFAQCLFHSWTTPISNRKSFVDETALPHLTDVMQACANKGRQLNAAQTDAMPWNLNEWVGNLYDNVPGNAHFVASAPINMMAVPRSNRAVSTPIISAERNDLLTSQEVSFKEASLLGQIVMGTGAAAFEYGKAIDSAHWFANPTVKVSFRAPVAVRVVSEDGRNERVDYVKSSTWTVSPNIDENYQVATDVIPGRALYRTVRNAIAPMAAVAAAPRSITWEYLKNVWPDKEDQIENQFRYVHGNEDFYTNPDDTYTDNGWFGYLAGLHANGVMPLIGTAPSRGTGSDAGYFYYGPVRGTGNAYTEQWFETVVTHTVLTATWLSRETAGLGPEHEIPRVAGMLLSEIWRWLPTETKFIPMGIFNAYGDPTTLVTVRKQGMPMQATKLNVLPCYLKESVSRGLTPADRDEWYAIQLRVLSELGPTAQELVWNGIRERIEALATATFNEDGEEESQTEVYSQPPVTIGSEVRYSGSGKNLYTEPSDAQSIEYIIDDTPNNFEAVPITETLLRETALLESVGPENISEVEPPTRPTSPIGQVANSIEPTSDAEMANIATKLAMTKATRHGMPPINTDLFRASHDLEGPKRRSKSQRQTIFQLQGTPQWEETPQWTPA